MGDSLKVALIHPHLNHGRLDDNLALLLELNQKAARLGARIILNTEMGLSGYGFDSRAEIAPLARTVDSRAVKAFGDVAAEHGIYLALGLAERDPRSETYYNTALLLGPIGKPLAKRRKITAESKWACPGPARQPDLAETPWGRVGLLICSETYFSLLPRALALKGADLLLVPANWPPGALDPRRLWRARALENGVYLAACNRAGQDKRLDMSQARSCVMDPWGDDLLPAEEAEPGLFLAELPLHDGRLPSEAEREHRLADRKPGAYHYIYSQLNRVKDLRTYLDLPAPGLLEVHALGLSREASCQGDELWPALEALANGGSGNNIRLAVLPALSRDQVSRQMLAETAARLGLHLACQMPREDGARPMVLFPPEGEPRAWDLPEQGTAEPPTIDIGPARVGLAQAMDLLHPELALAMAKRGCDLVAASGGMLDDAQREVLAMRGLERVTLALAFRGGGLILLPAGRAPERPAPGGDGQRYLRPGPEHRAHPGKAL